MAQGKGDSMSEPQQGSGGAEARLPETLTVLRDCISASSVDGLTESELLAVVSTLEATKGAAAALQARATAHFVAERDADAKDDASRGDISRREASCRRNGARAEVGLARRCSPWQADRHVGLAAALTGEMPYTLAALTSGEISEWRATILVRETACLSAEDRTEVDRRLASEMTRLGDQELGAAARRAAVDLDQEALVRRRRQAAASRRVAVRPAPDGMAYLSILGSLVDVVGAHAALTAAEKARFIATGDPEADALRAADDRGRGAWTADTALERLSGRSEGQSQSVEVSLVMSEGAVVATEDDCDEAEVPGWGPVPGEMAREQLLRLVDEGSQIWLRRLWTAPGGRDLVAMDSKRRLFGGGLRRLLELRDQVCRVPWCDAPVRQIDHVAPVAAGGPTSAANGMGECQRHNLVKEAPGWIVEVTSTGLDPGGGAHEVHLTTPAGMTYETTAPPVLGRGRPSRTTRPWSQLERHYEHLARAA